MIPGLYLPEQASPRARRRLESSPAANALTRASTPFLVYEPAPADDDLLLLHFPCSTGEESPTIAAACTCGLSEVAQRATRPWCFERFELVFAFYSPGFSGSFLNQMRLLARQVREWVSGSDPRAFGMGDWVEHFPLLEGQPSALLVPPAPELVNAGLKPQGRVAGALAMGDWCAPGALVRAGPIGFLQVIPLFAAEYAQIAQTQDGFGFFLDHLLSSEAETTAGQSIAHRMLDMHRKSAV